MDCHKDPLCLKWVQGLFVEINPSLKSGFQSAYMQEKTAMNHMAVINQSFTQWLSFLKFYQILKPIYLSHSNPYKQDHLELFLPIHHELMCHYCTHWWRLRSYYTIAHSYLTRHYSKPSNPLFLDLDKSMSFYMEYGSSSPLQLDHMEQPQTLPIFYVYSFHFYIFHQRMSFLPQIKFSNEIWIHHHISNLCKETQQIAT